MSNPERATSAAGKLPAFYDPSAIALVKTSLELISEDRKTPTRSGCEKCKMNIKRKFEVWMDNC